MKDDARHAVGEGHITTIVSAINTVFGQALPAAGLAARDMPDVLERYSERFDPYSGMGEASRFGSRVK